MVSKQPPQPSVDSPGEDAPIHRRLIEVDVWTSANWLGWGIPGLAQELYEKLALILWRNGVKQGAIVKEIKREKTPIFRISLEFGCYATDAFIERVRAELEEMSLTTLDEHPRVIDVSFSTARLGPTGSERIDPLVFFGLFASAAADERLGDARPTAGEVVALAEIITEVPKPSAA